MSCVAIISSTASPHSASAAVRALPLSLRTSLRKEALMADRRKPQEILDQITSSHATLESLIYSLDEHQQTKPGAIGKWTVKEVMAHIGHWEEIGYEVLYDFVHNGKKPTEDYTQFLEYNDKWEP